MQQVGQAQPPSMQQLVRAKIKWCSCCWQQAQMAMQQTQMAGLFYLKQL
jgi:hypothetical protein